MSIPAEKTEALLQPATLRRETPPPAQGLSQGLSLRDAVRHCLEAFFTDLDGHPPAEIYAMVLGEVEPAMLQAVLELTCGNQTRAAEILGINRTTLRKKLRQYGLGH
ncbi:MAG: helix-turn-helix domain-containing protein [Gammaproteobacteria bacterium]